jgi:hypothetical protein
MLRCAESLHDLPAAARGALRSGLSGPVEAARPTSSDGSTGDGSDLRRVACTASVAAAGFEVAVLAGTVVGWSHCVVPPGERPAKAGSTSCPCSAGSSSSYEPDTAASSRSAPYQCLGPLYSLVRVGCRVGDGFPALELFEEYVVALRQDLVAGSLLGLACGDALGAPFEGAASVSTPILSQWESTDPHLRYTDDGAMAIVLSGHLCRHSGSVTTTSWYLTSRERGGVSQDGATGPDRRRSSRRPSQAGTGAASLAARSVGRARCGRRRWRSSRVRSPHGSPGHASRQR